MRRRLPSPALVIACIALLLALGGTSLAALNATGSAVNITDPKTAANKAKVDATGRLQVNIAPSTPWSTDRNLPTGAYVPLAGPKNTPIDVTSLTISLSAAAATTEFTGIVLQAWNVPASATTCSATSFKGEVWFIPRITASAPFAVSFPTPLQVAPAPGKKVCLYARSLDVGAQINASGFMG